MRKSITFLAAVGTVLAISAGSAFAGSPDNPGAFGEARAEWLKEALEGEPNDTGAPGASEWGHIAGDRGSTNGETNRTDRESRGGSPNPGNDKGKGND